MAGIYIHIPFCRQICYYCDFYRVATLSQKAAYVDALTTELEMQNAYLEDETVETIYFGGGTPSVLEISEINCILQKINLLYEVSSNAEITVEANPDDLTVSYLADLRKTAINRLSIGIQSFNDDELKMLNRRHTATQAIEAVKNSQKLGFDNISIDLIYGLPNSDLLLWKRNLEIAFSLDIQHLSAYHLTYEPHTHLTKALKQNKIAEIDESISIEQFKVLIAESKKNGFEHYEISNCAQKGFRSKHNSSYWRQAKYLGVGASAHSCNCKSRQWNVSNVTRYIQAIKNKDVAFEIEFLDENTRFNEYVMTSLRTLEGIDLKQVENQFGTYFVKHLLNVFQKNEILKYCQVSDNQLFLTDEGKFVSDRLIAGFFV